MAVERERELPKPLRDSDKGLNREEPFEKSRKEINHQLPPKGEAPPVKNK
jgi:hypothetical protein